MDKLTWQTVGDELRAMDRWGDFDAARIQEASADPRSWLGRIDPHPINIMVNGGVSLDHFEAYVPTLLRALDELRESVGLEFVVRALTKKGMTAATERLVQILTDEALVHDHRLLWAVGNALTASSVLGRTGNDRRLQQREMLAVLVARLPKQQPVPVKRWKEALAGEGNRMHGATKVDISTSACVRHAI